jgi:hypothetical protein
MNSQVANDKTRPRRDSGPEDIIESPADIIVVNPGRNDPSLLLDSEIQPRMQQPTNLLNKHVIDRLHHLGHLVPALTQSCQAKPLWVTFLAMSSH